MKLFFEKADIDVKGSISDDMSENEFFNFLSAERKSANRKG